MIFVEWLPLPESHKERACQNFNKTFSLYVVCRKMYKHARLNIAIYINMEIVFTASHAPMNKVSVIPEICNNNIFGVPDLKYSFSSAISLPGCWHQVKVGFSAYWNIVEIPSDKTAFFNKEVNKFITNNKLVVCSCSCSRISKENPIFSKHIHCRHYLAPGSFPSSFAGFFFKTFNTDARESISQFSKFFSNLIVY